MSIDSVIAQFVFCVVVMAIVFYPLLFGASTILGDPVFFQIPYFSFYKEAIQSGDSFLWNPLNSNGFPAYAGMAGMFFPPHYIFLKFLSPVSAFNWLIFLVCVFTLFFMIRFLIALGISAIPAVIGGISFIVSESYLFGSVSAYAYAPMFIPLLFLIVLKLMKDGNKFIYIIVGGLIIGLAWLSVVPHFVLWTIFAAGSFAIYLAITKKDFKIVFNFIFINVIGLIIGLVQIWPNFWVAQLSFRNSHLPFSLLSEDSIRLVDLPRFFFPDFYSSIPVYASQDGVTQGSEMPLYVGIFQFLFLIVSFFTKIPWAKFFRWMFLIPLLIGIKYSPLFYLISKVPILNAFRVPSRYMLIGSFAAAVLIGLSLHNFISDRDNKKNSFSSRIIIAGVIFMCVFIVYSYLFLSVAMSISAKAILPFAFLISGYFLLSFPQKYKWEKICLTGVLFICVIDFILVFKYSIPFTNFELSATPVVSFLKSHPGKSATLFWDEFKKSADKSGYKFEENDDLYYARLTLPLNFNLFYNLESGSSYEKLSNRNVVRLFSKVGVVSGEIVDAKDLLSPINISTTDDAITTIMKRRSLFDFLSIKYILSGFDLTTIQMKAVEHWPIATNPQTGQFFNFTIFENNNAKPLFYFTPRIDGLYSDSDKFFENFLQSDFNSIFIECSDCNSNDFTAAGNIDLRERKNTLFRIKTESPGGQFLVFSQNYYPGWHAFVDSQETRIYKVNAVYMGIFVPVGEHMIDFKYSYYLPWD